MFQARVHVDSVGPAGNKMWAFGVGQPGMVPGMVQCRCFFSEVLTAPKFLGTSLPSRLQSLSWLQPVMLSCLLATFLPPVLNLPHSDNSIDQFKHLLATRLLVPPGAAHPLLSTPSPQGPCSLPERFRRCPKCSWHSHRVWWASTTVFPCAISL